MNTSLVNPPQDSSNVRWRGTARFLFRHIQCGRFAERHQLQCSHWSSPVAGRAGDFGGDGGGTAGARRSDHGSCVCWNFISGFLKWRYPWLSTNHPSHARTFVIYCLGHPPVWETPCYIYIYRFGKSHNIVYIHIYICMDEWPDFDITGILVQETSPNLAELWNGEWVILFRLCKAGHPR